MKNLLIAGLFALLIGCSDVVEESYSTLAEAETAGAVKRGWIPPFVPVSAENIHSVHNLDTNAQRLTFTATPTALDDMVANIVPANKLSGQAATKAIGEVGWDNDRSSNAEVHLTCTRDHSGAVIVNRRMGLAAYISPVEWARDDCPRPF